MTNEDGSVTIYETCWEAERRGRELEERLQRIEASRAVQGHLEVKRDTTTKKRGGRGC